MRFIKWLKEATVTGDVELNLAKGHVQVIGAPKYKKKKRKTRLDRRPITVHEEEAKKKKKKKKDKKKGLPVGTGY